MEALEEIFLKESNKIEKKLTRIKKWSPASEKFRNLRVKRNESLFNQVDFNMEKQLKFSEIKKTFMKQNQKARL